VSPLDQGASALVSKDRKAAYISVTLDIGSGGTTTAEVEAPTPATLS
jgi:hypothetical protein